MTHKSTECQLKDGVWTCPACGRTPGEGNKKLMASLPADWDRHRAVLVKDAPDCDGDGLHFLVKVEHKPDCGCKEPPSPFCFWPRQDPPEFAA